jgi:flagellar M-ring protein FliF
MDFLNKAMAQVAELFRSMTGGARLTAGLLLALVVVSLVWLFRSSTGGPDGYLMNGEPFPASQLPAMIAAFGDANLNGYQVDGNRIRVPRGQEAKYMAALAAKNALPHNPLDYIDRALTDNPFLSDRHQREAKLRQEKQRALSEIITQWPGIESATVLVDEENRPGYLQEKEKTASIEVRPEGSAALSEIQAVSIRQFVARSVAGLKYEKVGLIDVNSQRTYCGDTESPSSALDDAYIGRKRIHEKEWQEKILRALSYIPNATVSVNVDLDKEQFRREQELKPDPKTVPYQTREKSRTKAHEGAAPAGAAGFTANQPAALAAAKAKGSKEDEDESDRQETNVVGATKTEKVTLGMTPTRVAVSVGIPTSYFEQVWRERNRPDAGAAEKKPAQADLDLIRTQTEGEIRKHVAKLLPAAQGVADPTEMVTVTPFQNITPAPQPGPGASDQVLDWLGRSWRTLGLMLLGLVSLVMLRSMVRSAAPVPPAPVTPPVAAGTAPAGGPSEEGGEESQEAAKQRRLKRLAAGGPSLRDELSQLVGEDPDAAANILRTWIGSTS